MVQSDHQPREDVLAFAGAFEVVMRPTHHHLTPVFEEIVQQVFQGQDAWLVVDQRQHDHPERRLQLRIGIQLVQHHLRHGIALQLDNDAHPLTV